MREWSAQLVLLARLRGRRFESARSGCSVRLPGPTFLWNSQTSDTASAGGTCTVGGAEKRAPVLSSGSTGALSFSAVQLVSMEKVVQNLGEFEVEARRFAETLVSKGDAATLVTLSGNLGAGKTAFTKVVAQELGVAEVVNSPTFVLEKIYQLAAGKPFKRLIHIDAYRLEKGGELAPLGFDESMQDSGNLILLEWPEQVADALPAQATKVSIEVIENGMRKITYG